MHRRRDIPAAEAADPPHIARRGVVMRRADPSTPTESAATESSPAHSTTTAATVESTSAAAVATPATSTPRERGRERWDDHQ